MKRQENIFRILSLVLLLSSFFITIEFLGKSFLITGAVYLYVLFNKRLVKDFNEKTLSRNMIAFISTVLLVSAISYLISLTKSLV